MARMFLSWALLLIFAPLCAALAPTAAASEAMQTRAVYDAKLSPQTLRFGPQEIRVIGPGEARGGGEAAVLADPSDQTLTHRWVSGTQQCEVVTQRSANETTEAQVKRHIAAIKAIQVSFPPNPPPPSGG